MGRAAPFIWENLAVALSFPFRQILNLTEEYRLLGRVDVMWILVSGMAICGAAHNAADQLRAVAGPATPRDRDGGRLAADKGRLRVNGGGWTLAAAAAASPLSPAAVALVTVAAMTTLHVAGATGMLRDSGRDSALNLKTRHTLSTSGKLRGASVAMRANKHTHVHIRTHDTRHGGLSVAGDCRSSQAD